MQTETLYRLHYTYASSGSRYMSIPHDPLLWPDAMRRAEREIEIDRLHCPMAHARDPIRVVIWPDGATAELMQARADLLQSFQTHLPEIWQLIANDNRRWPTFSLDSPGQIAYADRPADRYRADKRTRTTIGRYLSRRLKVQIDRRITEAIELIARDGGYVETAFRIETDVPTVYEKTDKGPTRGRSCMSDNPEDCLDFYVRNKIKILVFGDYDGRALLWTLDNGEKFLDRIYPDNGQIKAHYKQYCHDHGIMMRRHNALPSGRETDGPLTVSVDCNCPMPYMDTFGWANNGLDSLCSMPRGGYNIELHNTDGGYPEDSDATFCERCENRCDDDDLTRVDNQYVCQSCIEDAHYCDCCQEYTFDRGGAPVQDDWFCSPCLESYAVYCDRCAEYVREEYATIIDNEPICNDCAEGANVCVGCGERTFEDLETIDGECYCESCAEEANVCSCGNKSMLPFPIRSPVDGEPICPDCSGDLMASF